MNINRVFLSGNISTEPELAKTPSGMSVLTFNIACNERKKNNSTGEWEDYPNFFTCIVFGKKADFVEKRVKKGSKIAIDGKLHFSQWEKDGKKRSKVEVIANEIEMFVPKNQSDNTSSEPIMYDEDVQF